MAEAYALSVYCDLCEMEEQDPALMEKLEDFRRDYLADMIPSEVQDIMCGNVDLTPLEEKRAFCSYDHMYEEFIRILTEKYPPLEEGDKERMMAVLSRHMSSGHKWDRESPPRHHCAIRASSRCLRMMHAGGVDYDWCSVCGRKYCTECAVQRVYDRKYPSCSELDDAVCIPCFHAYMRTEPCHTRSGAITIPRDFTPGPSSSRGW